MLTCKISKNSDLANFNETIPSYPTECIKPVKGSLDDLTDDEITLLFIFDF